MTDQLSQPTLNISLSELPTWMRLAQQRIDWGIFAALFFSVCAAWPFLLQDGLPRTNASENYIYLTADYAASIQQGYFYPRWNAGALYGFGAPIAHFHPPGAPLSAALLQLLFTNDPVVAVRLLYILALLIAGSMTYTLILRLHNARAAIIGSLLYIYSPYVGITAPHILGDLPSALALGLLPAQLWAAHRLLTRRHTLDTLLVSGLTGLLILTEPRYALCSLGLIGLLIWQLRVHPAALRQFAISLLLGVCSASIYWLPALAEYDSVTWIAAAAPLERLTFTGLFQPLRPIDLSELIPRPQYTLGAPALILSAIGFIAALRRRQWLIPLFGVYGSGAALAGALIWPEATWLMGPASLGLAVTGSAAVDLRVSLPPRLERLALPLLAVMILWLASPVWLAPHWSATPQPTTLYAQIFYEQQGFGVATLPPGAPLPITLPQPTQPDLTLIASFRAGTPIRLRQPDDLPIGRDFSLISAENHADDYIARLDRSTQITLLRSAFPGWQAQLNGRPQSLTVNPQTGLMQLDLATTDGREAPLIIYFGTTLPRQIAYALSGAAILIALALTFIGLRRRAALDDYEELGFLTIQETRLLTIVGIGFGMGVIGFASPAAVASLYPPAGSGLTNYQPLRYRAENGLELIAFQLNAATYQPEQTVTLRIAWRIARPLLENYQTRAFIYDANRIERVYYTTPQTPGGYPTRRWTTYRYITDSYQIALPADLPPGSYQIGIELLSCPTTCSPLNFFDARGQRIGAAALLPVPIQIER